jgi:predicted ArsR family transcriptional regulator
VADLRPSQIETLKRVAMLTNRFGSVEAADLAWSLALTTSAARRLKALVKTGHLQVEQGESANRRFYSLTNQGRTALQEAGE